MKRALMIALAVAVTLLGCSKTEQDATDPETPAPAEGAVPANALGMQAIAELGPVGDSGVEGRVTFTQTEEGVRVEAEIQGLAPGQHGFHIHEFGDCSSPDGKSAGGHFNPMVVDHAAPDAPQAHAGDLGNIEAGEDGAATLEMMSDRIQLWSGPTDVRGRGVIVHANPDDLVSQPTGAAGGRLACGVIAETAAPAE